ncbi:hypothetical protein SAY87_002653 [Trapa incisa]|uniref:mRNA cap guanine-N(7) methyltransferase 2 n=1 Tax=Trapa incisa TaxID=236973 RepID=A0AAN7PVH4_9MYRT|nr:hypothetical protein SAY87_002653 [Trapa incisa]
MSQFAAQRPELAVHRLYDLARTALIKIFVHPYATVCELYCAGGLEAERWEESQIGHYIGIDESSSGINERREAWDSIRKVYTTDFFNLDICTDDVGSHLQDRMNLADMVCCLQHLQLCLETEDKARKLLHNVSSLLKPGGYFFGIVPDSSTIWAKYQKNVEAYHNRSGSLKHGIVPSCIRSECYMITFEIEEEKFPLFGKKYQLKFAGDTSAETHCLVHFPSLIRLAREAGLEYVEIQNLTEFFDDNRAQFAGMLMSSGLNLVDTRGRPLPRSFDVLSLYTTFIFQKPKPDAALPLMTPVIPEADWMEEEIYIEPEPLSGLGKITEQKGILGPGPPELRFPEAL